MSPRVTAAVCLRVLRQLRRDHRTVALMLVLPCLLLTLMWWLFLESEVLFDRIGAPLITIFPFAVMFIVTSVATLRERTTGTLTRLLTLPMGKADLLVGYAGAFALVAILQGTLVTALTVGLLDLDIAGSPFALLIVVVAVGVVGTALGLAASAFASTEFQAVQMMPAFVLPQVLLCGLFVPRDQMPRVLELLSDVLPLSYAVDGSLGVATGSSLIGHAGLDVVIVLAFGVVALIVGAVTLRRTSP